MIQQKLSWIKIQRKINAILKFTIISFVYRKFAYFEKKKNDLDRMDERNIYNFSDYPDNLKKKVTLLKHFKNYMTEKNTKNDIVNSKYLYFS